MLTTSGISGLDQITNGGLPAERLTVVAGEPGCGKTIFSLQFLAATASEKGIFVSFEETPADIIRTAQGFGWSAAGITTDPANPLGAASAQILVLNANPDPDIIHAGEFDIGGLLGVIAGVMQTSGAKRVVFDGLDVLLDLLDDARARRRELIRIRNWVLTKKITAVVTSKPFEADLDGAAGYGFMRYMANALIVLKQLTCGRGNVRTIEVLKLRGAWHSASQYHFTIEHNGIVLDDFSDHTLTYGVVTERVSSGVERLDQMLGGGYFRGASILISGAPGTAKTSLAGSFVVAAAARGEKAVYMSFDEAPAQIERNLRSIGLDLRTQIDAGRLAIVGLRTGRFGMQEQFRRIVRIIEETNPSAIVIDPISNLSSLVEPNGSGQLGERIVDMIKARGATVIVTSLLDGPNTEEKAQAQISRFADTWIHLSFAMQRGERNRALTIIKSRGSAHSNQVGELLLSRSGVDLADVYTAAGEILMGRARLEREQLERSDIESADLAFRMTQTEIDHAEALAKLRAQEANAELEALKLRRQSLVAGKTARDETKRREKDERLDVQHVK